MPLSMADSEYELSRAGCLLLERRRLLCRDSYLQVFEEIEEIATSCNRYFIEYLREIDG
jgi:hypothetical protein